MKKVCILMVLFFASLFAKAQEVVLSRDFGSGSVRLERKTDNQSFRQNGDGSRFYKTTFTIKVNLGDLKRNNEITDIYSDKGTAMDPCVLIDKDNKLLYVFTLSKSNDKMYGMDGIVSRLDINSGRLTRENVFNNSNWGWYAYFKGLENGNIELRHFAYAGYANMCSTRNNNNGVWSSVNKGGSSPDKAASQRSNFDNILVIGSGNSSVIADQKHLEIDEKALQVLSSNSGQQRVNQQNNQPLGPGNKAKEYTTLPFVGPASGEFYVGQCMGTPIPKDPPINNRNMSMMWELDCENGVIAFSTPWPDGGGVHILNSWGITISLGNGQKITSKKGAGRYKQKNGYYAESLYAIPILNYNSEQITISTVTIPEQVGKPDRSGYYNWYVDNNHHVNYTLPINVKEAKAYYYYYQAKKASLKDAISYVNNCNNGTYKKIVEDEIVKRKINNVSDIVYCNDNYSNLSDRLEDKMFGLISSMADCDVYLKYYSTSKRGPAVDDKVYQYVNTSNEISDCETYLKHFPNGGHKAAVTSHKNEIATYNAAKRGGKAECTAYLTKYPNGRFTSEIQAKKDGIVKEEKRLAQIKVNSNKGIWKLGNKLCNCTNSGIIMVTLDQWNEDRSMFKGIVSASPGGLFKGDLLQKGNAPWFETKDWHICLDDEVEFALNNDKSLEAEQLMKAKKMKFAKGTVVAHTYYSRGLFFSSSYRVKAKVDDWNDDYTRMKIQIINTDGLDYIDGESIYEGKYIWVSPIGWE